MAAPAPAPFPVPKPASQPQASWPKATHKKAAQDTSTIVLSSDEEEGEEGEGKVLQLRRSPGRYDNLAILQEGFIAQLTKDGEDMARRLKEEEEAIHKLHNVKLKEIHERDARLESYVKGQMARPVFDAFRPLSSEETAVLDQIRSAKADQLMASKFGIDLKGNALATLRGLNWLDDEVINFYFNMIMERSENDRTLPRVWIFNSHFMPKIRQAGFAGVQRWTKKLQPETVFMRDMILLPVHVNGVHWTCGCINFKTKRIEYYDSMSGKNPNFFTVMRSWLAEESKAKRGQEFDFSGWEDVYPPNPPQQNNASDCGVFTICFAESLSRGVPFAFQQARMPYMRERIGVEIVTQKLFAHK